MFNLITNALDDLFSAMRLRRIWMALAYEDIDDAHRQTTLGPAWLLINYLLFVSTCVVIFGHTTEEGINYTAYVAIGLLVWNYLNEIISQGTTLFLRDENFIKGTPLPLSTFVLRQSMQSVIRLAYALVGCIAILAMSGVALSVGWIWSAAGMVLVLATSPAIVMIFAICGALFRDLQFIANNVLRIMMFATPVFWTHLGGGSIRRVLYEYNPATYFLDIVRQPILSSALPLHSFAIAMLISAGVWVVALLLLGIYRRQIVFIL
jgi:lipopolysaccharide transport system permease protein